MERHLRAIESEYDGPSREHLATFVHDHVGLLRAMLDAASEGILVVTEDRMIVAHNARFAELFGLTREGVEALGRLSALDDSVGGRFEERLATTLEPSTWEEIVLPAGRAIARRARSLSVDGVPLGFVFNVRDSDDQHDARARRREAELEHRLAYQSHHDALTGLPNRWLFRDQVDRALAHAPRNGKHVALLYLDLDRFKHVNDTLGHTRGDQLILEAARRLEECVRAPATIARLGGDEFAIVLSELDGPDDASRTAQKLIDAIRIPYTVGGHELFVSVSVGISIYPDNGTDSETLMRNADAAMFRAKDRGRDKFEWFSPEMGAAAEERMALETLLRHAFTQGQLRLHYQPLFDRDGGLTGFEALLRWHHPQLGPIAPSRFIPLAEECGLIVPIGAWVLREACMRLASFRRRGGTKLRMSVNVSPLQFRRPDWLPTVRAALDEAGIPADALELEITESLLLDHATEAAGNLVALRELGVAIAIDDFGTGYSSLGYLHRLPVSTLKIDQSFVREMRPGNGGDSAIVRTIIALAKTLGMHVVAEGVETEDQRETLIRLGCDTLQGFLLGRPMPDLEAEAFVARFANT